MPVLGVSLEIEAPSTAVDPAQPPTPQENLSPKKSIQKPQRPLRQGKVRRANRAVRQLKSAPNSDPSFRKTESLAIPSAEPTRPATAVTSLQTSSAKPQPLFSSPAVTITTAPRSAAPAQSGSVHTASVSQPQATATSSQSMGFGRNEALTIRTTSAPGPVSVSRAKSLPKVGTPLETAGKPKMPQELGSSNPAVPTSGSSSPLARLLTQKTPPTPLPGLGRDVIIPQGSPLLAMARSSSALKENWATSNDAGSRPSPLEKRPGAVLTIHKKVQPEAQEKPSSATPAAPTPQKLVHQPNEAKESEPAKAPANAKPFVFKGPAINEAAPVLVKSSPAQAAVEKGKEAEASKNPPETEAEKAVYKSLAYEQLPATVIASEEGPKITFGGDLCSFIGSVNQEDARGAKDGSPHFAFGWADLVMEISGNATDDFQYKYSADIQIMPNDLCMTDNYVELSSPFGTLQFGNLKGVESALLEDATSLNGGTGGVDGSVWDLFNRSAGLPNAVHLAGFTKRATKLTLYSPRFYGFKFGFSYTPNPGHSGWDGPDSTDYANSNSNDDDVFHNADMVKRNNLAYGINFEQSLNDLTLSAALVAVTEKTTMNIDINKTASAEDENEPTKTVYQMSREIALKKDTAIQASASIKYKNLQIAGGFIDNGELNLPKTGYDADRLAKYGFHLGNAGKGWNAGIKYTYGCLDVSLTHHNMSRRVTNYSDTKGTVNSFAVDCQILSGVKVFTEVNHISTSTDKDVAALYENDRPAKNKGTTIFVGSKVSF